MKFQRFRNCKNAFKQFEMDAISHDVLAYILTYLGFRSWCNARFVCRKWRAASNFSSSTIEHTFIAHLRKAQVAAKTRFGPLLEKINICGNPKVCNMGRSFAVVGSTQDAIRVSRLIVASQAITEINIIGSFEEVSEAKASEELRHGRTYFDTFSDKATF